MHLSIIPTNMPPRPDKLRARLYRRSLQEEVIVGSEACVKILEVPSYLYNLIMPSENVLVRQQEKPNHYQYLKSFRVEQCKDFLQHQCSHHKPYTCFNWHFPNQKRRKPLLNIKDGHFNYSPDQYCNKYDESNGACSEGDGCQHLHRNLGDSERRYHLRYYKVEMCSGDVDNHGVCSKNGIHCSFAHSSEDRRQPVYDIMEHRVLKGNFTGNACLSQVASEPGEGLSQSADKGFQIAIDPKWNETSYMLAHYKVEPCKVSGRHNMVLCPYYHSSKEKRRSIATHKYRAVACAMVKDKDEWLEPSSCDAGDACSYSHTRMELQYHPDVFRTVACTKEQKSGQCNKRMFCAFAHEPPPSSSKETTKVTEMVTFECPNPPKPLLSKAVGAELAALSEINNSLATSISLTVSASNGTLNKHLGPFCSSNLTTSSSPNISTVLAQSSTSTTNHGIFTDILSNSSMSALAPPFFSSGIIHQPTSSTFSAVATSTSSEMTGSNEHLLDALDDDFSRDVAKSPPPGFAKIAPPSECADMSKLKNEVAELQKQLLTVTKERDQAVNERNQAVNLLESLKNSPSFDESKFLKCLHSDLELDKLNLTTLFHIQSKLHKDVKVVDQMLQQLISMSERCPGCSSKVASMSLLCGHKLCPVCYYFISACPLCGHSFMSY